MNICLIGNYSGNSDEGAKLVGRHLAQKLARTHNVLKVDIHKAFSFNTLKTLNRFHPDILHYVPGPSPFSFMILRTLLLSCRVRSRRYIHTVMSATQPVLPYNSVSFLRKFKPDLLLVQSDQYEEYFKYMGFRVKYLQNGVDLERFKPATERRKGELRTKYGLGHSQFIILHIGPVRANRGIDVMKTVAQTKDTTVLIVGSTSSPFEKSVFSDLTNKGCIIWRKYIQSICELYQLADLYVFPVEDRLGSIDVPLSVLEAMACNLPVITTRFGGFPRLFNEGEGLFFVNNRKEIPETVKDARKPGICDEVHTRKKVMSCSWDSVSKTLSQYYEELLTETTGK